jgi:hypothetical protein
MDEPEEIRSGTILHADLDAFYASVEQLFDPPLRGKPIAVGSGVVLAASYEAKAFGVRGGMSGRHARELCPQLQFVSGNFKECQRLGDAAIEVLGDFTPLVERLSIDEAFADVTSCERLFGPPAQIAKEIRRRVRVELGLPISVGLARTKHLAKIASQVAKPDGLVVVDPAAKLAFLHDLPVELMWGVGPSPRRGWPMPVWSRSDSWPSFSHGGSRACLGMRWAKSSQRWRGTAIRVRSRHSGGRTRPEPSLRLAEGPPRSGSFGRRSSTLPTGSLPGFAPNRDRGGQ